MVLRNRLARLSNAGPATAPRAPEPASDAFPRLFGPVVTPRAPEAAPPPAPAPPRPPPAEPGLAGSSVLDDLRRRMDAILTRTRAEPPRPLPRVDLGELPFSVEHTAAGPLHVRTVRLSGGHRVGRAPVTFAKTASAELLALLALDPSLAGRDPSRALYLDTETTGLGPGAGTVAFLVGLAFFDDAPGLVVEQLLVRQLGEEAPVLARVRERLAEASMLVTYNGKSFDMPVLRTRFVMGRETPPPEPPHLDLVHVARRLHKGRGIGSKLGAMEREVLGYVREDDVPSGEVSACYLHFLRTGDARALLGVVDHNHWDVVSMAALVGLYGEPLDGTRLEPLDLVGVARTLRRAGEAERAFEVADEAARRGGGHEALRARGEIAKARGDKARALADFEALAETVDDPTVRLELAKLYEHHAKDAARALAVLAAGTSETEPQRQKREARLRKKVASGKLF